MLSPDQRKLYWVHLHEVLAARKDLTREDFHAEHNLPASTKDFTKQHFDTFLAACAAVTQPANLKPQLRAINQEKTRLLHKILVEQAAQLRALDKPDPSATILKICAEKFRGRKPADLSAEKPQSYSELEKLLFTIARAISELRQKRGWSQHDLNIAAGLHCSCATCSKRRSPRGPQPKVARPALRDEPALTNAPF